MTAVAVTLLKIAVIAVIVGLDANPDGSGANPSESALNMNSNDEAAAERTTWPAGLTGAIVRIVIRPDRDRTPADPIRSGVVEAGRGVLLLRSGAVFREAGSGSRSLNY